MQLGNTILSFKINVISSSLLCVFYFCLLENLVKSVDRESLMFSVSIFPAKKELFEITQNILCKFCMLVTTAGDFKLTEIDFNSLLLC